MRGGGLFQKYPSLGGLVYEETILTGSNPPHPPRMQVNAIVKGEGLQLQAVRQSTEAMMHD